MNYADIIRMGVRNGQYPQYLYKYRTIESATRSLRQPSIYMNSIIDFNDPYEGHFVLEGANTFADWKCFLEQTAPCLSPDIIKYKANEMTRNPQEAQKLVNDIIQSNLANTGVFCLSTNNKNIPMWAYYAEEHKGICIEYDILQDEQLCDILLPVNYSNDYIRFNYLKDSSGVTKAIRQKAECWKHESEYRLIKLNKAKVAIDLTPKAISSIIFGCRFVEGKEDATKEFLELLHDPKYSHVKVKRCIQKLDSYELQIVDTSLDAVEKDFISV